MFNEHSIRAVDQATGSLGVLPLHGSYCFSSIPSFVLSLLTGAPSMMPLDVLGDYPATAEKVVLFFIDAFGWRFLERFKDENSLLREFRRGGVISKITSQFPSTTAAHVTTIHTGLPVSESGVLEWQYYEPLVDSLVVPLRFTYARAAEHGETLRLDGVEPSLILPQPSIYHHLHSAGVGARVYQNEKYALSTYSSTIAGGARICPFSSLELGLQQLSYHMLTDQGPGYYFFYTDVFDAAAHVYGPESAQAERVLTEVLNNVHDLFLKQVHGKIPHSYCLMTADHGQTEINPKTTYYVNELAPELLPVLERTEVGEFKGPAGSPRDMFLHVYPEEVNWAGEMLQEKLDGIARVIPTEELVAQGFFGAANGVISEKLGSLAVLPFEGCSVWWYEEGRFYNSFYGHHGGLTPEEMEIPLILYPLS